MSDLLTPIFDAYRVGYLAAQSAGSCDGNLRKSLEANGNTSTNWSRVFIKCLDGDECISIRNCSFDPGSDGCIIILSKKMKVIVDGVSMSSSLHNSNFFGTCFIGPGSTVLNTSILSNVYIGPECVVVGCGTIRGPEAGSVTTFGNYEQVSVGSESGGGRTVTLDIDTTFFDICQKVYSISSIMPSKFARIEFNLTVLSRGVKLMHCATIENCLLSDNCSVANSTMRECTVKSTSSRPSSIRAGAQLQYCLVSEGCVVEDGCYCDHVYMCEASSIGVHARVCDSILAADASIAGGECHRSLVGPFIGFHHHSLLIASLWPFGRGNLGYGAKVGANHTGRVNDQECWPGEGCFYGLGCSIKFPSNLYNSPYSIVAPDTGLSPQCIQFPCSLICALPAALAGSLVALDGKVPVDACLIKPAWILYANPYMMDRAISKFTSRRKAKHLNTSYPVYRPTVIRKMILARSRIQRLLNSSVVVNRESKDSMGVYVTERVLLGLGRCVASLEDLQRAVRGYTGIIRRYALHGLLSALLESSSETDLLALLTSLRASTSALFSDVDSDSLESSLRGMVEAIAKDLEYYNPDPQSPMKRLAHTSVSTADAKTVTYDRSALLQDSHTEYVNRHQLQVLRSEYTELLSTHTEGKMLVGTLLGDLVEIEKAYAEDVRVSRQKDADRGTTVIPDYARVNKAAVDIGTDAVVTAALKRVQGIINLVQGIRTKFDV